MCVSVCVRRCVRRCVCVCVCVRERGGGVTPLRPPVRVGRLSKKVEKQPLGLVAKGVLAVACALPAARCHGARCHGARCIGARCIGARRMVRVAWWALFRYVRHAHCSERGVYRMGAAAMPCALLLRTARRAFGVIGWLAGRSVVDSVVVVVVDAQDRRVCRTRTTRSMPNCCALRNGLHCVATGCALLQRVALCCNGLRSVAIGLHRVATWRQPQAQ